MLNHQQQAVRLAMHVSNSLSELVYKPHQQRAPVVVAPRNNTKAASGAQASLKQELTCPLCRTPWGAFCFRPPPRLQLASARPLAHPNTHCKGCGQDPIVGNLFTCITCARLQLCSACFEQGDHPQHAFVVSASPGAPDHPASRQVLGTFLTGVSCRGDASTDIQHLPQHKPRGGRHAKTATANAGQRSSSSAAFAADDVTFAGILSISHVGEGSSARDSVTNGSNGCSTSRTHASTPETSHSPSKQHSAAHDVRGLMRCTGLACSAPTQAPLSQRMQQGKDHNVPKPACTAQPGMKPVSKKCSHAAKHSPAECGDVNGIVGNVIGMTLSSMQAKLKDTEKLSHCSSSQMHGTCKVADAVTFPALCKGLARQRSNGSARQRKLQSSSKEHTTAASSCTQDFTLNVSPIHLFAQGLTR